MNAGRSGNGDPSNDHHVVSSSVGDISIEKALRLLANPKRRSILHHFTKDPSATTITDLIEELRNNGTAASDNPDALVAELYHIHLPKLREAGVLDFDTERRTVELGQTHQEILSLLEAIENHQTDTGTD